MEQWTSAAEELESLRASAARASCTVRYAAERDTPHGRRAVGRVTCPDGWAAARFLLAQALEDASTPAARAMALDLRTTSIDEADYVRRVFELVKDRVAFVREIGEVFTRSDYTLAVGAGDCDDHARVVYTLLRAAGVPARLAFLYRRGDKGPRHVLAQAMVNGRWTWLETTIDAEMGEHPYEAARRLGKLRARQDIATEVRFMTEADLAPLPAGFATRTTPAQLELDTRALQELGFLAGCVAPSSVEDLHFRRGVVAFQRSKNGALKVDGLIGEKTRGAIAAILQQRGGELAGLYMGELGKTAKGPTRIYTHATAREDLRRAYVDLHGREPSDGELDFGLAVAYFESGYGRAGAADWANLGQFARWASEGWYNWGALQSGTPGPDRREGKDAGRKVYFYVYPSDFEAARAFLRSWGKPDTLAAAATGSSSQVSAAMKRHGYYEGFWVAPGGLVGGKTKERGFKEAANAVDAEEKNILDYARALDRYRSVVVGPGGVPDPSPLPQGQGGAGTVVALLLVLGAVAGAWWAAGQS